MRHRKAGLKLSRRTGHLNSLFRNLVTSLLKYDRIRTTDTKAKELRRWADHVITLAKRGDLHARRQALAIIQEPAVVHKVFENAQKRFGQTAGGYTRLIKLGLRPGDAAPMTLVELIGGEELAKKKKKKGRKKPEAAKADKGKAAAKATEETPPAQEKEATQAGTAAVESIGGEEPAKKKERKARKKPEAAKADKGKAAAKATEGKPPARKKKATKAGAAAKAKTPAKE